LHCRGISGGKSLAAHRFDLVLQLIDCRSGHGAASSLFGAKNVTTFSTVAIGW